MREAPKIEKIRNVKYFNLLFAFLYAEILEILLRLKDFVPKLEFDETGAVTVASLCAISKFCLTKANPHNNPAVHKPFWYRLREKLPFLNETTITDEQLDEFQKFLKEQFIDKTVEKIKSEFRNIGPAYAKIIQEGLPEFIGIIEEYLSKK